MSVVKLSPHVVRAAEMMSYGYMLKDVARDCQIGISYMKKLMNEAYQATGTDNKTAFVAWAIRNQVIK